MSRILRIAAGLVVIGLAAKAQAYVDLAPTLAKVANDSQKIAVVEVVEVDTEARTVTLKETKALKGELGGQTVRHIVATSESAAIPRHVLQWASLGARGVIFTNNTNALVCVGRGWYQVSAQTARVWKIGIDRPDLPLSYYGSVSRLEEALALMLSGKDAVITTIPHGAVDAASFDLALNRAALPGSVKVQRIRANLKMASVVMSVSNNPAYLIGQGAVDEKDLPELMGRLKSRDAAVRAEAAEDLRSLEGKAAPAVGGLTELLGDASPRVRVAAASALMRIEGTDGRALEVLGKALESSDSATLRCAAEAASYAGPGAAEWTGKLAALLKDGDAGTRVAALQALAVLGPRAAAAAADVKSLLSDQALAIDAADALGRMGEKARPIPEELVKMLSSEQPAVRWAAVRAMSQIGGDEAKPAVAFMSKAIPTSQEVDLYNIHIYLSLLGPTAKDAMPEVKTSRFKNPVLPAATLWAMEPEKSFPWETQGRGGPPPMGPGGFGGPGEGGAVDLNKYIYEAFFIELGPRLAAPSRRLADAIVAGKEGEVPSWGYGLLACDLGYAMKTLTPRLSDKELVLRERAVVALGYLGEKARAARPAMEAAMEKAQTPNERMLMKWSLRRVGAN